jgi:hypothetical protein
LLGLLSCQPAQPDEEMMLSGQPVILLDSAQASTRILQDREDHYFQQLGRLDIQLQMKDSSSQATSMKDYESFLRREVSEFTAKEQSILQEVFAEVDQLISPFGKASLSDTLFLIKTKGRQYGPSIYYTRERNIIIPADELEQRSVPDLCRVMMHEIFHIYARYHPEQREQLYKLIGFKALKKPVNVPDSLQQRLLLNPDGVNWKYGITFDPGDGQDIMAVPLITSARPFYSFLQPDYFDYLSFQLYPLKDRGDAYEILVEEGFRSPLPPVDSLSAFHHIIGDNTGYIIHPDEILADNFVLLLLSRTGKAAYRRSNYSSKGQEILRGMEEILQ